MRKCLSVRVAAVLALVSVGWSQNIVFEEIGRRAGLRLTLAGRTPGMAVGDYDGDGWMDVVVFGADDPRPQVFKNNGASLPTSGLQERQFSNVSHRVIPADAPPTSVGLFGDLDNDGDLDLVLVERHLDADGVPNHLDTGLAFLENVGGRFKLGNSVPDLGRSDNRTGGLALGDVDNDSDLDIVFCHNKGLIPNIGGPGMFARNDGQLNLSDATSQFGADIDTIRRYFTVVLADFNGDMLLDMHCAVDFGFDYHCENVGNGVFQDISSTAGANGGGSDMGLAIGDIDNDGDLDMYATNINIGVLHVNDGNGHFTNESQARGVYTWEPGLGVTTGWGTTFSDFDNDGDLDLAVVGYGSKPGSLFENDGTGHFTRITASTNLTLYGHGLIPFDFDRDGDQDLLIMKTGPQARPRLYENVSPASHWLTIDLFGKRANRAGVGSKVEVVAGGVTQTRTIVAGYSYKSGPPMNAHFGLGASNQVDSITVTWSTGEVTTLGPLTADRYLTVYEP